MPQRRLLHTVLFDRPFQRILILFFSLLAAISGITGPFFQKTFVDQILGYPAFFEALAQFSPFTLITAAFFLAVAYQFFSIAATYLGNREAVLMQKKFSEVLYNKMLSMRTDQLQTRATGEVVALFATDVPGATILLEQSLPMAFSIFFPFMLAPILLTALYGLPLWSTVSVILAVAALNTVLARRQSAFFYKFKQLAAERVGYINEWVQNIRTLRVLSWVERFEKKIFAKRQEETANRVSMVTNGQVMNSISSSVTFFINLSGMWALLALTPGPHSPGQILALFWILGIFLTRSFRQMPWFFTFVLDGMSSLNRIQTFLDQPDDKNNRQGFVPSESIIRAQPIHVDGMNLKLQSNLVLRDIHLRIEPGEFVAVVGEVGSGKTMLLLSLLGEAGAHAQEYRLGQVSALSLDKNELKSHFAFVPQEGFVMSANIRENVAFDYEVDTSLDGRVQKCLKLSQFDLAQENFIEGLDTEIGERGVNLSGGQRQRLNLARSDYFDRPILLLDDCLSALDVDTEKKILASLIEGQWKDRTRILVTHRLTILPYTDRILFMRDGKIIDRGTFTELLQRNEEFREFTHSLKVTNGEQSVAK